MERALMVLGTIQRLEKQMDTETDPRTRQEIAETLDLLETSLAYEVDKAMEEIERLKRGTA